METKKIAAVTLAVVLIATVVGITAKTQIAEGTHKNFKKLVIGFIPTEKAEELTPKANDLEKYLEEKFRGRVDVEVLVPTSYESLMEGLRFGHVHAAFMDTGPGWIAYNKAGAEVVFSEVVNGKVYYQATVFARADDDSINTIDDAVGKRVAFTSITGSSGFVRPVGTLVEMGLIEIEGNDVVALEAALGHAFKSYTFTGGYKSALELLVNGNVDVAFGADDAPQRFLTSEQQGKVKIVEKIGPVPSHVFVVGKDVPRIIKNVLVDAMIELNYEENNQILKKLYGAEALLPTTTTMHIGDFGNKIDVLTGLEDRMMGK
ncbi:MAG: phosphate/phosphite/phosphonate ABC transporter substrate-binding protein [Nitrososphaerales archaeon]